MSATPTDPKAVSDFARSAVLGTSPKPRQALVEHNGAKFLVVQPNVKVFNQVFDAKFSPTDQIVNVAIHMTHVALEDGEETYSEPVLDAEGKPALGEDGKPKTEIKTRPRYRPGPKPFQPYDRDAFLESTLAEPDSFLNKLAGAVKAINSAEKVSVGNG